MTPPKRRPGRPRTRLDGPGTRAVIAAVAAEFGLEAADIATAAPGPRAVVARRAAVWLVSRLTAAPARALSEAFGGLDRRLVLHAVRRFADALDADAALRARTARLVDELSGGALALDGRRLRRAAEPATAAHAKPPPTPTQKPRACLGPLCRGGRAFLSDGPGNRLCKACRNALEHGQLGRGFAEASAEGGRR